jgi:sec-independent protein translocase protein TatB
MFDFAFSEIALVGVVALLVIGPKDMPVAIKALTDVIKKARRMAGEFHGHVDEMMREADLHEVRDTINDLRSMNVKGRILSAVDGDGSIRRTLNEDPLRAPSIVTPAAAQVTPAATAATIAVGEPASGVIHMPDQSLPGAPVSAGPTPAFVPPAHAASMAPPAPAPAPPPAFIPPSAAEPRA